MPVAPDPPSQPRGRLPEHGRVQGEMSEEEEEMSECGDGEGARRGDEGWVGRTHRRGRASRVGLALSVPVCA